MKKADEFGGYAGGDKYLYNNQLFKFARNRDNM